MSASVTKIGCRRDAAHMVWRLMWCAPPSAPSSGPRKHIKERRYYWILSMSLRRPIPLFPNPPDSPRQSQDGSSPPVPHSEFGSIRIIRTPDTTPPASIQPHPRSSFKKHYQPQHGRNPKKGLGQKNRVNTIHSESKASAKHAKVRLYGCVISIAYHHYYRPNYHWNGA